ncbi:mitoferrin [Prunus yedoensis var. nudiflora]|uniref:Mitoferrin n=1 Tax=Prunus yedoensis var. nudiflora TaxID=2094558 RepID=A0A314YJJ9_PRUYE|nr:mitoferrin [Prunus yedoensis var. nudiflora]
MATDATPKFKNPDFRPISQPQDYRQDATVSAHDGLHFWQFMIAGSIAGMVEHMAMFPVDTIKTHMQALGSCPIKSVGVRQALGSILKSEGPPASTVALEPWGSEPARHTPSTSPSMR